MSQQDFSRFNIPIEGIVETQTTMPALMKKYRELKASNDHAGALEALQDAVYSAHLPAKLEMARYLRDTPSINMSQRARYRKSELLFREVLNLLDMKDSVIASVSMDLAMLCDMLNRPVGTLGHLLRAKRHGYIVPEKDIESCRRKLAKIDVNAMANAQDCYDLGHELFLVGSFNFAEMFLQEACASDNIELAGRASLDLADLFYSRRFESNIYREEASKYYRLAEEKGFPELLSRN